MLALGAIVLAFLQHPGKEVMDSRIELTVDPALFLQRIASVWSPTTDLGHIQSGQFVGYLFPMAPWVAAAKALGVAMWVAERLWLGGLLAIAGWGVVRLMDELYSRERGVPHVVAALVFAVNPYVVSFASRASVALLAHAILPWLMVAAHRGIADRDDRWRWAAVVGIAMACSGGGVNAALLPWIAAAPIALVAYEWLFLRARTGRDVWAFSWRATTCALLASAWWIVPVALQSSYGGDFLAFIEQPHTIWATPSMSESFRLLGYWIFYFWGGYGGVPQPLFQSASTYLFDIPVILATFAVPLVAIGGLPWLRRWRFAPYFLGLTLFALLIMAIGFPQEKPLERALEWAYYHAPSLRAFRTTYKAAPVLALAFACLGGATAQLLVRRALRARWPRPRVVFIAAGLAVLAAVPVLYGLPFFRGTATDSRLQYRVPAYWSQALADANRTTAPGRRLMILPGQLYAWYRWGETVSSIAPAISKRPVVVRDVLRYADPRASQLLATVDDLVQQARLVPGQLPALLRLMAVGQVLVPTDARIDQSGETDPATVSAALAVGGFAPGRPAHAYGQTRPFVPTGGRGGRGVPLPDLRRYPVAGGPGIVRIHPQTASRVLDGDAEGIADLAAVGLLDPERALFNAGDLSSGQTADRVRQGAALVFSDSNRRNVVSGVRVAQDQGPTLGANDPIEQSLPSYTRFLHVGGADQTIASDDGLRSVRSPESISSTLLPQYRPYAALDGRLDTTWLVQTPDPRAGPLNIALSRPRPVRNILVHPHDDALGYPARIGVTVNGGAQRSVPLKPGWNAIAINAVLRTLRLRILHMNKPFAGAGGLDEVQIPGLRVQEALRLPTRLADQTRGLDLRRNALAVVLQRTTADFPYRAGDNVTDAQRQAPTDAVDAESGIRRIVTLPVARSFGIGGWGSVAPSAPDHALDRLAGMTPAERFDGSSRFEGVPGNRASSAFDGDPATAWVADDAGAQPPSIAWSGPRLLRIRRLRLTPASPAYGFPTILRVKAPGRAAQIVAVGKDGLVVLPEPVVTRALRLDVLYYATPPGPAARRLLAAVGIAEIRVPGLRPPRPRRSGTFQTSCGAISAVGGGSRSTLRLAGTVQDLDAGRPLALRGCGPARSLRLAAGSSLLNIPPGPVFRADYVRLASTPAPSGPAAGGASGRVTAQSSSGTGSRTAARLSVAGPSWLVLGQSYSPSWHASCSGHGKERDLGPPVPIDGFANGWRVQPGCSHASFVFAPQRFADASYVLSVVALVALLAVLVVAAVRNRRRRPAGTEAPSPAWGASVPTPVRRFPLWIAIPAALVAGTLGGVTFAWRAGPAIALAVLVLLVVGVSVMRFLALAIVGLVALPVLYVVRPFSNVSTGNFANFTYPQYYIVAHWVAVGAVCALIGALLLWLAELRAVSRPDAASTPSATRP
ncbi:MAG TPA: alpha-(1-_3)-arabinofuranosyltransferase family protein [Solirubrobacteraceae bacterium]|nr:alpha-(1->3)-arabinofuranosyltransferase family protein [Solirubrobacteraceae bacterium]